MLGGRGPGGKKVGSLAGVASASEVVCSETTCKQHNGAKTEFRVYIYIYI